MTPSIIVDAVLATTRVALWVVPFSVASWAALGWFYLRTRRDEWVVLELWTGVLLYFVVAAKIFMAFSIKEEPAAGGLGLLALLPILAVFIPHFFVIWRITIDRWRGVLLSDPIIIIGYVWCFTGLLLSVIYYSELIQLI